MFSRKHKSKEHSLTVRNFDNQGCKIQFAILVITRRKLTPVERRAVHSIDRTRMRFEREILPVPSQSWVGLIQAVLRLQSFLGSRIRGI